MSKSQKKQAPKRILAPRPGTSEVGRPQQPLVSQRSTNLHPCDQIQFLLGHVSIQTTERYLGCKQKLRCAVNDTRGIEPGWAA